MEKGRSIFFILFVTLLFAFTSVYSSLDKERETDLLFLEKYEDADIDTLYAREASNLDGGLAYATLFSPLPDPFSQFLSSFFSSNTLLVTPFSVLRC
jgi:hypothetical protein